MPIWFIYQFLQFWVGRKALQQYLYNTEWILNLMRKWTTQCFINSIKLGLLASWNRYSVLFEFHFYPLLVSFAVLHVHMLSTDFCSIMVNKIKPVILKCILNSVPSAYRLELNTNMSQLVGFKTTFWIYLLWILDLSFIGLLQISSNIIPICSNWFLLNNFSILEIIIFQEIKFRRNDLLEIKSRLF